MFKRGVAGKIYRSFPGMLCLLGGLLIMPGPLPGQQVPAATGGQNANQDDNSQDKTTEIEVVPGDQKPLVSLDSGQVVNRGISRVHWGRLSLFSLNISAIRDDV